MQSLISHLKHYYDKALSFIRANKFAVPCAAAVVIILFGIIMSRPGVIATSGGNRELPIYSVQRDDKVISISFDAAWGADDTQTLIDILADYDVKTTFFVVAQWVDKYPEQIKALFDAGHEIMNHSATHAHFNKLSPDQIRDEINTCNDKIEAITGVRPDLFRAPYGEYNNTVISTLREMGMYTIQWDVDSLDWKNPTVADLQKRVTSRVKPGSIVLFHNDAENTPAALPGILKTLTEQGYKIVPISQIIYRDNYVIDHAGMQIPKTAAPQGSWR